MMRNTEDFFAEFDDGAEGHYWCLVHESDLDLPDASWTIMLFERSHKGIQCWGICNWCRGMAKDVDPQCGTAHGDRKDYPHTILKIWDQKITTDFLV